MNSFISPGVWPTYYNSPVIVSNSYIEQPVLVNTDVYYLNVNKDPDLRKEVTKFFKKKILHWINNDANYLKFKNQIEYFQSSKGEKYIYNLLRKYIKKTNLNWYDLRTNIFYIKEYFIKKL